MSKKIVIVSGGELEESFVLSELETLDSQFIIGVDKGMEFLCLLYTSPSPRDA